MDAKALSVSIVEAREALALVVSVSERHRIFWCSRARRGNCLLVHSYLVSCRIVSMH